MNFATQLKTKLNNLSTLLEKEAMPYSFEPPKTLFFIGFLRTMNSEMCLHFLSHNFEQNNNKERRDEGAILAELFNSFAIDGEGLKRNDPELLEKLNKYVRLFLYLYDEYSNSQKN